MTGFDIFPLGDRALTLVFGDEISPVVNDKVICAQKALEAANLAAISELVPTYCTLMVHYDKRLCDYDSISESISVCLEEASEDAGRLGGRSIELPVCYGGEFGPDIAAVAAHAGVDEEEVIKLHTEPEYRVYMLGFLAGFPYLGGLNPKLNTPRLDSPRKRIEAGSVGIAGAQTGAYSIASPGGWQLIGRTPVRLYDPSREEPAYLQAGDRVRFRRISAEEYDAVASNENVETIANNEYDINNKKTVRIANPGLLSTIQDMGRRGYQAFGVSVSGAMDRGSAALANYLVGNDPNAAVLESMILGPGLEFNCDIKVAVTGANTELRLNGQPVLEYSSFDVKAGDRLECGPFTAGTLLYIAFAGGIDVPLQQGSRSTHIRTATGGIGGRALRAGDLLPISASAGSAPAGTHAPFRTHWGREITLRVIPDRFTARFTQEGIATFYRESYAVSSSFDRMGYRLEGPAVEHTDGADIITDGVIYGSVQIPPNGIPIIMMADCQTTGGYTRIGNIHSDDLPKLAQCGPGCRIRFEEYRVK